MTQLIRKGQAAELLGVSAPRVSQLLRAGHLSEVAGTGMLSREEVEQLAQSRDGLPQAKRPQVQRARVSPASAPRPELPRVHEIPAPLEEELPPIGVSRQRLEALRTAIAQHDLDTRSGKLVSRADMARAAFQEGQRIR
jgi:hypothetical protein